MRKLLLGLLLSLMCWGSAPAQNIVGNPNAILCNKVAASGSLSAGTAQQVAGITGVAIHICGYIVEGLAAGTVQLVFGTGSTCTTPTVITPNFTTTATTSIVDHIVYAFTSSGSGQTLCAVSTGTTSVIINTYYAQF
jgi:hypothetical protein